MLFGAVPSGGVAGARGRSARAVAAGRPRAGGVTPASETGEAMSAPCGETVGA